jgi:large repetitive protein
MSMSPRTTTREPTPVARRSARRGARRSVLVIVVAVLLTACQSAAPGTGAPSTTPAGGTSAPTTAPPGTPVPAGGEWVEAGELNVPREAPHVVLLGDGRVLAVGDDHAEGQWGTFCGASESSVVAELWDPATGAWTTTAPLATPRALNVALPLADGRAIVTAGANAKSQSWEIGGYQSYSSTWIFDPGTESWMKSGLLETARTAPVGAVLPDGRVLVAGGFYADVFRWDDYPMLAGDERPGYVACPRPQGDVGADAVTAAWHPVGPCADVAPNPPPGRLLVTAEVFDPATGSWSSTGPLAVPRVGQSTVTLGDGRVLVAGESETGDGYFYGLWTEDERAARVAEVYDPATGRFRVTGEYPVEQDRWNPDAVLVATADGGALLIVGAAWAMWHESDPEATLPTSPVMRYDPGTNEWTAAGSLVVGRAHAAAALLPDGRILVAGGEDRFGPTLTTEIYDPVTGTSTPGPSMPEPRADSRAVVLADGSVLLVGGYGRHTSMAVRYIPGS